MGDAELSTPTAALTSRPCGGKWQTLGQCGDLRVLSTGCLSSLAKAAQKGANGNNHDMLVGAQLKFVMSTNEVHCNGLSGKR